MILSQAQAEAVYSAMAALNNVGGEFDRFKFEGGIVIMQCYRCPDIEIMVYGHTAEQYPNQAAFATAYTLN